MRNFNHLLLLVFCACLLSGCEKEKKYPKGNPKTESDDPQTEVIVPTNIVFRLAGDSTCCPYPEEARPQTGWGECIAEALGQGVQVENYAVGGESTKSFADEGKWTALAAEIQTGDVVLIQFGHNDEKSDEEHHTDPATTYKEYLTTFINETREKGGIPVLLTSICRRSYHTLGAPLRTHGDYPAAMRELAEATETALVDAEDLTYVWLAQLGKERSEDYFVMYKRGATEADNTHLTDIGAKAVAEMIAKELKKLEPWKVTTTQE